MFARAFTRAAASCSGRHFDAGRCKQRQQRHDHGPLDLHREAVDELRYPWSSIGKLFNETGSSCSGVVIARDKILTAAHCLFNARTRRFIPAEALHFLVGYRTGRYSAHARIVSYEIGAGFDPLRYSQTSEADWAVLTVTQNLPAEIEPLRLRREASPSGTKAVLVGYPQERAFAMSADRDCELGDKISAGRLLLHTCRSTFGYSGGPILVSTGGREMEVAGIQIAAMQERWHGKDDCGAGAGDRTSGSRGNHRDAAGGRGFGQRDRRRLRCGFERRNHRVPGDNPRSVGFRTTGRRHRHPGSASRRRPCHGMARDRAVRHPVERHVRPPCRAANPAAKSIPKPRPRSAPPWWLTTATAAS